MIVCDASAILELLLQTPKGEVVAAHVAARTSEACCAPHLLDVDVVQVLRRLVGTGTLPASRAREALIDLRDMALTRYPHEPLVARMWDLRDNLTTYDAVYVALAESLEAPILTCDRKLARTPGVLTAIELVE